MLQKSFVFPIWYMVITYLKFNFFFLKMQLICAYHHLMKEFIYSELTVNLYLISYILELTFNL